LSKKFSDFYVTVFRRAGHLTLSWASWIQSKYTHVSLHWY